MTNIVIAFERELVPRQVQHEGYSPWRPPIEVFETAVELVIRMEIGGISIDEVQIALTSDEITIRGVRRIARTVDNRVYHESRIRYGPFLATVRLPFPVVESASTAHYVAGFLTLVLPRAGTAKVTAQRPTGAGRTSRGER